MYKLFFAHIFVKSGSVYCQTKARMIIECIALGEMGNVYNVCLSVCHIPFVHSELKRPRD